MADELALTAKYGSLISALARSLAPEDVTAFLSDLGALADSGLPNLSPLLKYILHLKGKPYTLQEHFPFEPVFNTTLPKSLTLKTGRQVSKCVSDEGAPLLYAPNGQPRKFEEIKVGDKVLSVNRLGLSNAGTVTGVFAQEPSDLVKVVTSTGCWCIVTKNHKLLTPDGYKEAKHLCQQDRLAVIQRGGFFSFSALSANSAKLAVFDWMAYAELRNNSELRLKEEAFVLSAPEVKALIESFLLTNAVSEDGVLKVTHDRFLIEDVRSLLWKLEIPSSFIQKHTQTSLAFDTKNSLSALKTVFPKLTTRFDLKEPDRELERSQDLLWDPIVEITSLPQAPSFDIEVEEDHNYVLNGLVSHNSTSLASQGIILAATFPFFNTLYVTPLYEMIRRFSNNYVRGFIEQSPIKRFLLQGTGQSNVMQRSFYNNSTMFFSFAFLDCQRVRGLATDRCCFDELQNMDETFLPIIRETMSASKWGLSMYAGTPLTMDNTLEKVWKTSSQAEWLIDCKACNYTNVPAFGYDIDDMIGPVHDDISKHCPALICAKCKRPIQSRTGRWVHKYPERRFDHAGYHVPQIILPMHYESYDKWATLCAKREGAFNTTPAQFYNEVLGESYDDGAKLLAESELTEACMLHENTIENAQKVVDKYTYRVLGIDWGGGGAKETSFTTYAVVGLCPDGSGLECFYGYRSLTPHDHKREARMALQIARELKCDAIAHDFNGAGAFREEYITTAGYPLERIAPISYVRATVQAAMRHVPATDINPRAHYRLDKTRSLVTICHEIKAKRLRFFAYDYKSQEQRGLVQDFMALVEEKTDTRTAGDTYVIIRQQNQSDDFAHAVNYAASLIWHITDLWPKAAHSDRYRVSDIVIKDLDAYAEDF